MEMTNGKGNPWCFCLRTKLQLPNGINHQACPLDFGWISIHNRSKKSGFPILWSTIFQLNRHHKNLSVHSARARIYPWAAQFGFWWEQELPEIRSDHAFGTHASSEIVSGFKFTWGQSPFDMIETARELELIANNQYIHQPFVDVSWSLPKRNVLLPFLFRTIAHNCTSNHWISPSKGLCHILGQLSVMESMEVLELWVAILKPFGAQLFKKKWDLKSFRTCDSFLRPPMPCAWSVRDQTELMPRDTALSGGTQPCTEQQPDCGNRVLTWTMPSR